MAKLSYTDQEHYLIRSLVLLQNMIESDGAQILTDDGIRGVVGKPVPAGTLKMVGKDAYNALAGNITFDQYFLRTSQTKRKETK